MKCQCIKRDGMQCTYAAKIGDFCGIHAKNCPVRVQQQRQQRQQRPQRQQIPQRPQRSQAYENTKLKAGDRLSARSYYDNYGPQALGDRCDIRNDGEYKCLIMRGSSPIWQHKTKVPKAICEDYSPRCKDPEFR